MGMKENAEVVRNGYDAFAKGDLDTLRELIAADVVWQVPGKSPIAGDKKGIDATLGYFGQLFELTDGTIKAEPLDVCVGDDHVIVTQRNTGERNGKSLEVEAVLVFSFRDGKISRCSEFENDQYTLDAFFS
ncbi:MAG TPA: nuclear transport factor 2 family protein [Acidimicrobiales bacterium]|nr:nuclear transport factor 2 family protein [Acidimicrobiales bacterium]